MKQLRRIVAPIRAGWPQVKIVIRGDRGSCREAILRWCEDHGVDDVLGLAQDPRLVAAIAAEQAQARQEDEATKQPARVFAERRYRTLETWSRGRRVVAQAEHLEKGANPRFVVPSLSAQGRAAKPVYEADYCGRGETEDRIQEQPRHRFADRTGAPTRRANPIRRSCSSLAYGLREALRRLGRAGTELAWARCPTIRLKRVKVGALGRVTVRKVGGKRPSGCPYAEVFRRAPARLVRLRPLVLMW